MSIWKMKVFIQQKKIGTTAVIIKQNHWISKSWEKYVYHHILKYHKEAHWEYYLAQEVINA